MQKRFALKLAAACAFAAVAGLSHAQQTIKIANIVELSGPGTTAGTLFKNGVELAVKEINEAGGILGKKIESTTVDTQTNPGVAKGLTQKAVDDNVFAIFGPVYSGSIMVSMAESKRGEVPNFTGGEAAGITQQGNPYIFRTSFTQASAMPKIARYIKEKVKAKTVDIIFVNNDFGKGGRDLIIKSLQDNGVKIGADVSTESGQIDFSSAVIKVKQSSSDAVFVYTNEEEAARVLRELKKQGYNKPVIGETVLTSQKVIELAGEFADGAIAHVGLTADAPNANIRAYKAKFQKEYGFVPDHNAIKGYTGVYVLKAAIEKVGKFDRKEVAKAMHGIKILAKDHPGVLLDIAFDDKGDLDRESYFVQVKNGKQEVIQTFQPAFTSKK